MHPPVRDPTISLAGRLVEALQLVQTCINGPATIVDRSVELFDHDFSWRGEVDRAEADAVALHNQFFVEVPVNGGMEHHSFGRG